jgi:hypothetical protein
MELKNYKTFEIDKRNGKTRTVYSVNNHLKIQLKECLPYLENRLTELDNSNVNYAFEKGKNCVQGALKHIGFKYTLSMDLANFFDSIKREHVSDLIDKNVLDLCLIDDAPKQGLPTSPLIATIAFLKCDEKILNYSKYNNIVYTRYADDLIFSFNERSNYIKIESLVNSIVDSHNFSINPNKTKLQSYKNGRRIITGIGVDKDKIYPTRKILKKIRAAVHQRHKFSHSGLVEWSKCKLPKQTKKN